MVNSKCNSNNLDMDASATLTPLSSTRDAPFVIQMDDSTANTSNTRDGFAHKLRTKTSVLHSVPENRSVRAESNQSTQSQTYRPQQCPYLGDEPAPTKGEWTTGLVDCRKFSNVFMLACCPCIPAAKIHGMLGSSFESGVIYFGGLMFGILISLGLCFSNNTNTTTATSSDGNTAATTTITVTTSTTTTSSNTYIFGNLALLLLVMFLLGVAFLRTRTRLSFNIPGSRAFDCCLSIACCWCVLSQTQNHMEKHNRCEFGLDTPSSDTLPAYT